MLLARETFGGVFEGLVLMLVMLILALLQPVQELGDLPLRYFQLLAEGGEFLILLRFVLLVCLHGLIVLFFDTRINLALHELLPRLFRR